MIEAVRTAPYHSWKNPCERVNCILNLGLQAVGLMRTRMEQKYESAISGSNSIQEVRNVIDTNPGLKEALQDSVEPTKILVHSLFSRLCLKDKPMLSYSITSEHKIVGFFDILHDIEPTMTQDDTTKKKLQKLYTKVERVIVPLLLSAEVCF